MFGPTEQTAVVRIMLTGDLIIWGAKDKKFRLIHTVLPNAVGYINQVTIGGYDMGNDITLSGTDSDGFAKALKYARKWCAKNQIRLGLGEMAIGASLVAWGVHNGVIDMGTQLVATQLGGRNVESILGTLGGTGTGAIAGSIVGSIGIAGMGGAIGVPAALVIGGSAAVLGMAGYTIGDIVHNAINPPIDMPGLLQNGSILLVGVALIIDGGRRCIKDKKALAMLSDITDNVIHLKEIKADIVAKTSRELKGFVDELGKLPEDTLDASVNGGSAFAGMAVGAIGGTSIAAGTVTVLGSKALGGVALSMGIVSAPVWPVVASAAGGLGLGYAAYKAVKYWRSGSENDS